jgi:hypothetical protein
MSLALITAATGAALLVLARLLGRGADPIGHRAYNKVYSDAPGARTDR